MIGWCCRRGSFLALCLVTFFTLRIAFESSAQEPAAQPSLLQQTDAQAQAKSAGCVTCHKGVEPMHDSKLVRLGCTDCHGGCATTTIKEQAHVHPRFPERWPTTANPERTFALLNNENPDFIRFINPGDWRAARKSCGTAGCHEKEVSVNFKSLHGHSSMVPGSALYNNGSLPNKVYRYGESYGPDGRPQRIFSTPRPTAADVYYKGVLPFLDPLPRFEITQPGNIFRVLEINNNATSERGPGTDFRVDAVFINVVKTKLNDPTMVFLGTNDHPGDYRSSGCTSCHVPYANDRDSAHSAHFAKFGNRGMTGGIDDTIPKDEPGHPVRHKLTRAIPSSQCLSCHFHQGSGALANYYGYMWWDYESNSDDVYKRFGPPGLSGHVGGDMYTGVFGGPKHPDMPDFAPILNPVIKANQFADFHNAGWPMQAVYKRDKKGRLVDAKDQIIPDDAPDWHKRVVHLADVHMEKGMHCVDCHFYQDTHGNGKIYGAMIDETEINCKDCHGTIRERANLKTSNANGGNNLALSRTGFGTLRFVRRGDKLFQRSAVTPDQEWEIVQVMDTITPGNPHYSEQARLAKTMHRDGQTWGVVPNSEAELAHSNSKLTCYACHTSWNTTCSGCHLDAYTNLKTPNLHYEGEISKVYAAYNPEAMRSDGFALGINGTVQGHKVSPVRSASGVIVSARDGNRAMVVHQQPTVSAEGQSGHAFTPNPPHTVRTKETQRCTNCHVSKADDNNAMLAQVLGFGCRGVDMIGRYVWVAEKGKGIEAVRVTEGDEFPQPVIGSDFHRVLNGDGYQKHEAHGGVLTEAWGHKSHNAYAIQKYGEWALVADGEEGFRVYDIANVANKNVAQRIVESPLSPAGQWLRVKSRCATAVGLASVLPTDTHRTHMPENEEQPVHPIYNYAFVTDFYEGLIVVDIHTLVDGNPSNNFLRRADTYNPGGMLDEAVAIRVCGTHAYVLTLKNGLVVLDVSCPTSPQIVAVLGENALVHPRAIDIQFRYAFICDCEGLKVVDITHPEQPHMVASVPLADARGVCVMRTYAYVAAGAQGLAIIDVERPTHPVVQELYSADGCINDATAVVTATAYASLYAYVADGQNGLRVIQLTTPLENSDAKGFSPTPRPKLIASYHTKGFANALSEGMPRDRYVDEDGNQIGVFGRRGSRPFNRLELQRMYLREGNLYQVTDEPPGQPQGGK